MGSGDSNTPFGAKIRDQVSFLLMRIRDKSLGIQAFLHGLNQCCNILAKTITRIKNMIHLFWSKTEVATRRKYFFYKFTSSYIEGIVAERVNGLL